MRNGLKVLRVENGLTQDQMAVRLGVSRTTYNKIETGKSDGTMAFWFNVKKEFPEVDIFELTKPKEAEA